MAQESSKVLGLFGFFKSCISKNQLAGAAITLTDPSGYACQAATAATPLGGRESLGWNGGDRAAQEHERG